MIYIKSKYGIFVLIGIFLALFSIFIFGEIKLKKMHYTEINRVINNNGGTVINIQKVEESPLQTSSRNNIYKIEYMKDGKKCLPITGQ
ncbi:hypothetical protein [Paenibacillus mesotrionivorans]|uniref:Uncharacterized protein n=1 Tax=Paenibacillus mesotrionivorans TaxID=3160968 RepID=A0ACC7PBC1_9BACL